MLFFSFLACSDKQPLDSAITEEDSPSQQEQNDPSQEPGSELPSQEVSNEPSTEPSNEASTEPNNEASNEPSQEPDPIITQNGTWESSNIQVVSDACDLANYQDDLTGFAPDDLELVDSNETEFTLMPDDLICSRNDLEYSCEMLYFVQEESVLGFSANLQIENQITGSILDEKNMTMDYEVTITSCEGWGCGAMELVLTWPCIVELSSDLIYE